MDTASQPLSIVSDPLVQEVQVEDGDTKDINDFLNTLKKDDDKNNDIVEAQNDSKEKDVTIDDLLEAYDKDQRSNLKSTYSFKDRRVNTKIL